MRLQLFPIVTGDMKNLPAHSMESSVCQLRLPLYWRLKSDRKIMITEYLLRG